MFIESVQSSLDSVRILIKNCSKNNKVLPISTSKDTIKCLDFDIDKVVFKPVQISTNKVSPVQPYKKSWLEVMDMV